MARQLRKETPATGKKFDYSIEMLEPIAEMLDDNKALHINTLYFTADGNYWINVYQWQDKVYSRLDYVPMQVPYQGGMKWSHVRMGLEENLIVEAMDAQEIVDRVRDWQKAGRPETNKPTLESVKKPIVEKKLSIKEKIEQQKAQVKK